MIANSFHNWIVVQELNHKHHLEFQRWSDMIKRTRRQQRLHGRIKRSHALGVLIVGGLDKYCFWPIWRRGRRNKTSKSLYSNSLRLVPALADNLIFHSALVVASSSSSEEELLLLDLWNITEADSTLKLGGFGGQVRKAPTPMMTINEKVMHKHRPKQVAAGGGAEPDWGVCCCWAIIVARLQLSFKGFKLLYVVSDENN